MTLQHARFDDARAFFSAVQEALESDADFLDGVVFGPHEMIVTTARCTETATSTSDYTDEHVYYRSLQTRTLDHLTISDYLWRWDTDWFWCSKNLGAQHPLVRRLLGKERLNSRFYTRVMRWNSRWRILEGLERAAGFRRESVIQDVDVPIDAAVRFLEFFLSEIGILPVWICPVRRWRAEDEYPLFPLRGGTTYINFGFWDVLRFRTGYPAGYFNRKIERMVAELGGLKSHYSSAWYPEGEFWTTYGGDAYQNLKERYDPNGRLPDLFEKCVRGA